MKRVLRLSLLISLVMSLTGFAATASTSASQAQPLDKIVAIINSDVVTNSELQKQINLIKQQMQSANAPMPDDATLRSKVLDQLIDQKLLFMLAKRNKVEITDAQVNQSINDIAARNNMNMDQFKLAVQKQGMTYNDFRQQIHDQMLTQQVELRALGPSLAISDQEIKDFLRQHPNTLGSYHLLDVLIPYPSSSPSAQDITTTQKTAITLLQQLQASGVNQPQVLKAQKNALIDDLGWRAGNQLPTIFAQRVANMKTGDLAGPIQAPNGFHLIKLVEIKSTGQPLTEEQVRQILFQRKLATVVPPWIQQIRSTAYVKIIN